MLWSGKFEAGIVNDIGLNINFEQILWFMKFPIHIAPKLLWEYLI